MADFSKFKIGNTSYNVKDANAARDISLVGSSGLNQGKVQLTKANGQAIGNGITIDINDNVSIDHTYIDSQTLADGDVLTWDANGQSWQNKPASGGSSYTPNMICGITVDAGNLRGFDIAGYRPISIVEGNASLMVRAYMYDTNPQEFVDCIPAGVKIKDKYNVSYASWETFFAAYPNGDDVNLDLYLVGLLSSGIVKISISCYADANDRTLSYFNGSTATATTVSRIGQ